MKKMLILLGLLLLMPALALAQVPRVVPQEPRPDGSIIHVVRFGDTIDGIIVAYMDQGASYETLSEYNGWRFPPQFISVDQEIIIRPGAGGSVAPVAADSAAPAEVPNAVAPAAALRVLSAAEIQALLPLEPIAPFIPSRFAGTPPQEVAPTEEVAAAPPPAEAVAPTEEVAAAPPPAEAVAPTEEAAAAPPPAEAVATEEVAAAPPPAEAVAPTEEVAAAPPPAEAAATEEAAAAPPPAEAAATEEAAAAPPPAEEVATEEAAAAPPPAEAVATEEAAAAEVPPVLVEELGAVCVVFYDDANQNGRQDAGEEPIDGGQVALDGGAAVTDEPLCFSDLTPGSVTLQATPPDAYALTSGGVLQVQVVAGRVAQVSMGAAQGAELGDVPQPIEEELAPPLPDALQTVVAVEDETLLDRIYSLSGLLVLLVAAGVLALGILVGIWLRFSR